MRKICIGVVIGIITTILCGMAIKSVQNISNGTFGPVSRRCGDFIVCTKLPNFWRGGITVTPSDSPYPVAIFQQRSSTNKDNHVTGYVDIWDSKDHEVQVKYDEAGRIFTSLTYAFGLTSNRVSYIDRDMDGEFDTRLGPDKRKAHFINGKWYDIQLEKTGIFAKDGENLRKVVIKNEKWTIDFSGEGVSPAKQ